MKLTRKIKATRGKPAGIRWWPVGYFYNRGALISGVIGRVDGIRIYETARIIGVDPAVPRSDRFMKEKVVNKGGQFCITFLPISRNVSAACNEIIGRLSELHSKEIPPPSHDTVGLLTSIDGEKLNVRPLSRDEFYVNPEAD